MCSLETVHDWTTLAACHAADPDQLFVTGAAQNRAKAVCMGCPVRTECLADALDSGAEFGVWGGMTERERRALLRRRPDVTSWKQLFNDAKAGIVRQGESHAS
ncbi:MAG: transcription factor WhiB [Frankiales bacterium]|nr:transcription factor WhiB [Frankiales bacterium]